MVRENLSKGLGFSKEDRDINIRRIGFVCELLSRNGVIAIVAAISPYRAVREEVRARIAELRRGLCGVPARSGPAGATSRDCTKRRWRARSPQFTGVSDPYEPPLASRVVVHSDRETPEESADRVWATLEALGLISF